MHNSTSWSKSIGEADDYSCPALTQTKKAPATIKIAIASHEEIRKQTIYDVEHRIPQKEDLIVYFESIEDFRAFLTPERMRLLRTARVEKPESVYELAKLLERDFKSVLADARHLENIGLLSMEKYKAGMRVKVRPVCRAKKIEMEIKI